MEGRALRAPAWLLTGPGLQQVRFLALSVENYSQDKAGYARLSSVQENSLLLKPTDAPQETMVFPLGLLPADRLADLVSLSSNSPVRSCTRT